MQPSTFYSQKKTHYLAIVFAIGLIILMLAEFASFSFGAYFVFNKPISNVVAQTKHTSSNTTLELDATHLNNNSLRTIWINPELMTDANGTTYVNADSGFKIANTTTDSNGNLSGSFPIPSSTLDQISSDSKNPQEVWVIGTTSTVYPQSPRYVAITSDSEQNYSASTTGSGLTFFATLITFVVPFNFSLGGLFLALWTIYLILFAAAMNGPLRNMIGAMKAVSVKGAKALFENSMFATLAVFPIILWVTVAISLFEQAGGVSTGSLPQTDPLLQMVELSIAPLREELGFRVIPIGLTALLLLLSRGRLRDGILTLWHPSRYLKKADTPAQYRRDMVWIYVMIGVSATLFGLAHVLLGAGWGPGKILSAGVAGVGLAVLYYLYGFPAAVLLHWSIDYFLTTFDLIPSLQNFGGIVTLYTLGVSIAAGIVLTILFVRRFRNRQLGVSPSAWVTSTI